MQGLRTHLCTRVLPRVSLRIICFFDSKWLQCRALHPPMAAAQAHTRWVPRMCVNHIVLPVHRSSLWSGLMRDDSSAADSCLESLHHVQGPGSVSLTSPRSFSSFWSETVPDVLSHNGLPSNPLNWKHFCKNTCASAAPRYIIRKVVWLRSSEAATSSRAGERIQYHPGGVVCRPLHWGPPIPGANLPAVWMLLPMSRGNGDILLLWTYVCSPPYTCLYVSVKITRSLAPFHPFMHSCAPTFIVSCGQVLI